MSALMVLILVMVAITVFSLAAGITAMTRDGDVAHHDSAHWMMWRVVFQAAALALMLLALKVGWW